MSVLGWGLSAFATGLALVALWLYGNDDRKAPAIGLAVCLIWGVYDVLFEQWPLLLPTALNAIVAVRNWWRMKD